MASPCFLSSDENEGSVTQTFPASDTQLATYDGAWQLSLDLQRTFIQVSNTTGDRATIPFTGVDIQVVGSIFREHGSNTILFWIDSYPHTDAAGFKCTRALPANENEEFDYISLFDTAPLKLSQDTHTLIIMNGGGSFSLHHFEVFANDDQPTSTLTPPPLPPSTPILPQANTPARASSISDSKLNGAGTTLQSTTITATNPSYTVSSYTRVSSINGTPTTIVIQTTIGLQETRMSHGLSKGVLGGVVTGGAFLLLLFVGVGLWWCRHNNRLRSLKAMKSIDYNPDIMTTSMTTQTIQLPRPPMEPISQPPVATLRSRKNVRPSPAGASFAPEEEEGQRAVGDEEEENEDGGEPSDLTAPHFSSTLAEPSIVGDHVPSRSSPDRDVERQIIINRTEEKPESSSTPANIHVPTSPPIAAGGSEGSAQDNVPVTGGDDPLRGVGTRVRRVLIEEDSGIRLAGGRLGEAREEEVESGAWEVLPPPYQEY